MKRDKVDEESSGEESPVEMERKRKREDEDEDEEENKRGGRKEGGRENYEELLSQEKVLE